MPGVTVEKKEGRLRGHKEVILTDLPGIYSLSPYTLEEVVTRDYLIEERPPPLSVIRTASSANSVKPIPFTAEVSITGQPSSSESRFTSMRSPREKKADRDDDFR
mgnify:CR=1 FL=1